MTGERKNSPYTLNVLRGNVLRVISIYEERQHTRGSTQH